MGELRFTIAKSWNCIEQVKRVSASARSRELDLSPQRRWSRQPAMGDALGMDGSSLHGSDLFRDSDQVEADRGYSALANAETDIFAPYFSTALGP